MIFEAAHQIALVPILALLLFGRRLPREYWLVALAWAVSWVGDSVAAASGGSWAGSYVWLQIQFALVLAAVALDRAAVWFPALVTAAVVSAIVSAPGPEWIVTFAGSAAVLTAARGALAWPLRVYFGAGTLAYFAMVATAGGNIMPAWYAYQGCRALAFVLFVGLVIRKDR